MIRSVRITDAKTIANIYNYYVKETNITFEKESVNEEIMKTRIETVTAKYPWIVYEEEGEVIGYAYSSKWRERIAYSQTSETSVYLYKDARGKGIGKLLYVELLSRMKSADLKVAIGCITMPNDASVRLHEKLGFSKVGIFHEVGYKFDQWLDVGFWELKL